MKKQTNNLFLKQLITKRGPALLIGLSPDRKFANVSYAVPKEERSKTVGPCFNVFIPITDILEGLDEVE